MPTRTGMYSLEDLRQRDDITVQTFGEAELAVALAAELEAHNRRYRDMAAALMDVTTERIVVYGGNTDSGELQELDEFSRTPTQREIPTGGTFNLPLRKLGDALGWTRDRLLYSTVAQIANETARIENKDIKSLYSAVRKALFTPVNYTVRDFTVDHATLNIKRLVNADGMDIPNSPEGTSFNPATHTHYLANLGWTNEAVDSAINTVREHGHRGALTIAIHPDNRNAMAGLTKYQALRSPELNYAITQTTTVGTLDNGAPDDNRQVAVWDGFYQVWTKPWVPAGYVFVWDAAGPNPLAMRIPDIAGLQGLRLVSEIDLYPLRADYYEHRFGVAVRQRTNGAILYTGAATYTAPSA